MRVIIIGSLSDDYVIIKITNDREDDSSDDKEDSNGDRPTSVPEATGCYPDGDDYADDHDDETYGDDHSYGDDNHGDDHGCPTSMPETPGSDHAIILMMPIATTMMIIMIRMMK